MTDASRQGLKQLCRQCRRRQIPVGKTDASRWGLKRQPLTILLAALAGRKDRSSPSGIVDLLAGLKHFERIAVFVAPTGERVMNLLAGLFTSTSAVLPMWEGLSVERFVRGED